MLAFIFDSVSFSEWAVLLVVFLIIMGPRKIPQTARTLGNYYSKLRRAAESFKRQLLDMETEFNKAAAEVEKEIDEANKEFTSEGDESGVLPSSDAYYPPETDEYGAPVDESGEVAQPAEGDAPAAKSESDSAAAPGNAAEVASEAAGEPVTEPSKQS